MASAIRAFLHGTGPVVTRAGVAIESLGSALGGASARSAYVAAKQVTDADWPELASPSDSALVRTSFPNFVAPSASVSSSAKIADGASVWYGATVSGDVSLAEGCVVLSGASVVGSASVGAGALISARASVLDGAKIGEGAVVSAAATVGEGAVVESGALVGPGAKVPKGAVVRSGEFWAGSPAQKVRDVKAGELEALAQDAAAFARLAPEHAKEAAKDVFQVFAERSHYENRLFFLDENIKEVNDPLTYFNVTPDPNLNPERGGLVFDSKIEAK
mmetsp:Transcript_18826/g.36923  ORF Transcript_18826/g.36923 Transcript_18826/m.36923 type:complete len:275 (+) Transcript_18826:155-979(+)|eukprot:CAMPEP_0171502232 /NCGR_PEP_ID=MMETSP0958-20121227/10051_1 /TAXON_ID=87120 /ORGANISM="Aurantiochytrium limacinum, Strain ATCCMYA-1381" /LENGTH=274 /DNA_ID=CAMNT_0012037239 /DNA_START=73 /DNA_END=897 /DNA_ORIENTATION=+